MRYYKYLAKYPAEIIADRLGVKPATVKRWKRENRIPDRHKAAVRTVKEIRMATKTRRKAILRDTHYITIAALADVSRETAHKWQIKGELPLENRAFLADMHAEDRPKKRKSTTPIGNLSPGVDRESEHFRYQEFTWEPALLLTDSVLVDILAEASKVQIEGAPMIQFKVVGSAELEEFDDLIRNYKPIEYVMTTGKSPAKVPFYTELFTNKRMVINSLENKLKAQLPKSMTIDEITLQIRTRIK